jgi:hypothetical protein
VLCPRVSLARRAGCLACDSWLGILCWRLEVPPATVDEDSKLCQKNGVSFPVLTTGHFSTKIPNQSTVLKQKSQVPPRSTSERPVEIHQTVTTQKPKNQYCIDYYSSRKYFPIKRTLYNLSPLFIRLLIQIYTNCILFRT